MNRYRPLASAALFAALAVAAGCGKKADPAPDPAPEPPPGDLPRPDPLAVEKRTKAEAQARLRQIGLAMHNYESTMGQFPAGVVGPKGEFGLSWRVQILPYLEGDGAKEAAVLCKEFNLKEPWDSDHNKKLVEKMPKVFESPGKPADKGKTYLRSFVGPTAFIRVQPGGAPKGKEPPPPFPNVQPGTPAPGRKITDITDGTSGTLMVAEAAEPVEWTKPDDLPFPGFGFDPKPAPLPKLGGVFPGGFHGLMCDGKAQFFPAALDEKTVRAMITVSMGEVLPEEVSNILFPPKPKNAGLPSSVPETLPDAAARKAAVANYQKILKGLHDHHDAMHLLPAGVVGPNKAVGLSWRVQVLPYIGEEALYKEFKLDEAWDSEHNKKLIEKMPKVFESPGKAAEKGHTFVRTTMGRGGIIRTRPALKKGEPEAVEFRPDAQPGTFVPGRSLASGIPDGSSNTILFVEAGEAVPWTKPDELLLPWPFDPKTNSPVLEAKLPPLGGAFADGFHAVMCDGRVTFFKTGYPSGALAKMFCPDDGWLVDPLGEPEKIAYSVPSPAVPAAPGKGDPPKKYVITVEATDDGAIRSMTFREEGSVDTKGENLGADVQKSLLPKLKSLYESEKKRIEAAKAKGTTIPDPKITLEFGPKLLQAYVMQVFDAARQAGFSDIAPVPIEKKGR